MTLSLFTRRLCIISAVNVCKFSAFVCSHGTKQLQREAISVCQFIQPPVLQIQKRRDSDEFDTCVVFSMFLPGAHLLIQTCTCWLVITIWMQLCVVMEILTHYASWKVLVGRADSRGDFFQDSNYNNTIAEGENFFFTGDSCFFFGQKYDKESVGQTGWQAFPWLNCCISFLM